MYNNSIKKYEHLFKDNKYLLEEPEIKQLFELFDKQLKLSLYNMLEYLNMSDVYFETPTEREEVVEYFLDSDWYIDVQ